MRGYELLAPEPSVLSGPERATDTSIVLVAVLAGLAVLIVLSLLVWANVAEDDPQPESVPPTQTPEEAFLTDVDVNIPVLAGMHPADLRLGRTFCAALDQGYRFDYIETTLSYRLVSYSATDSLVRTAVRDLCPRHIQDMRHYGTRH
jgi:hypothetical protein